MAVRESEAEALAAASLRVARWPVDE
jgi:hypothetical protein